MFFSFLVLFAITSFLMINLENVMGPRGYDHENIYRLEIINFGENGKPDDRETKLNELKQAIQNLTAVKVVSRCGNNTPYGSHTWTRDKTEDGRELFYTHLTYADYDFHKVWNLKILDGRWYEKSDEKAAYIPIVINETFKEYLYGSENAIGKLFDQRFVVIGVVEAYRYKGEFSASRNFYFAPLTASDKNILTFVIKTRPEKDFDFEIELTKAIKEVVKDWNVEITAIGKLRKQYLTKKVSQIATSVFIALFLLLNVALGISGILWYNITRRKAEIGLLKALGASTGAISTQIVIEMMILACFGIFPGYLFILNLFLLNLAPMSAYIAVGAMFISTLFMCCLVAVCSLYPSRLAARIKPAIALNSH
jgi:putative ABC transport system permease protein